jgi:hypothetical protein
MVSECGLGVARRDRALPRCIVLAKSAIERNNGTGGESGAIMPPALSRRNREQHHPECRGLRGFACHGDQARDGEVVTSQGTLASAVRSTAESVRFGEKKDLRAEDLYREALGWLETQGTSAWQSAAGSLD